MEVALQPGCSFSLAKAHKELSEYGEIARLEVPPDGHFTAIVSFYDKRASELALQFLGDCATQEPNYGEHTVHLSGDTKLEEWMLPEIAAVRLDKSLNSYILEFYDSRTAGQVARQFNTKIDVQHVVPISSSSATLAPRYRNDLRLSEVKWSDLASGHDKRTELCLRCLPKALCNDRAFEMILTCAGLCQMVKTFSVHPGKGKLSGRAFVSASDTDGVIAVAKFFHGRQWGRSPPVTVSFASTSRPEPVGSSIGTEPWRIETCSTLGKTSDKVMSETSTEIGDDLESLPHPMVIPCLAEGLIGLPPGLA